MCKYVPLNTTNDSKYLQINFEAIAKKKKSVSIDLL